MRREMPQGTLTVLFTDVEDSTKLGVRRGDEAAHAILGIQRDLVRRQVEQYSGLEVKSLGDGFMVAFASARDALACAVTIQQALAQHNRQHPHEQIRVRMGLSTGEAIQETADLFGETVNVAARVAGKAKGGQILLSESVRGVLGRITEVPLVDRGRRFRLKGFPERWRLYEVDWRNARVRVGAAPILVDRTPFVGREMELSNLRRLLNEAIRGSGTLVMVAGEAGIGKTRFLNELLAEAGQSGALALTGHCYEMEGASPYVPFVEALENATRVVPAATLRDALGEAAPEVARLMPELRRLFSDIQPPLELPPEQERRYLFNSILEFLERAARRQPLILVLEDLHWGEDSTLLLLRHIAHRIHEMPILVVGTYRDSELNADGPLARALEEFTRQRSAHPLTLKRLSDTEAETMLRLLSGQPPPAPLVQIMHHETDGNPFFLEEVYRHLVEQGKLFDERGRWRSDLTAEDLDVPPSILLAVGRRLERLTDECRQALTAAAVIGRTFDLTLLQTLANAGIEQILQGIDEAERARLITSSSDGIKTRFTFHHELIRHTLLNSLSRPRRQQLHLQVAEAIERLYDGELDEQATDLAHHLYEAGNMADWQDTVRYLVLAGERAMEAEAFEDGLRQFERAISLQQAHDRRGRADLMCRRALAQRSLGHWAEALDDWWDALSTYEVLGDIDAASDVSKLIVEQLNYAAKFGQAQNISDRALAMLGEQVTVARCFHLAETGFVHSLSGDFSKGSELIRQALDMAEKVDGQRLLTDILACQALHHWSCMQYRESADLSARIAKVERAERSLWWLAEALWLAQWSHACLGDLEKAKQLGEELDPLASRLGHLVAAMISKRICASRDFMITGNIRNYEGFLRGYLDYCIDSNLDWKCYSHMYSGLCHFWMGRPHEALDRLQLAADLEPEGPLSGMAWGSLFVGKAYLEDGPSALTTLERSRGKMPRPGQANSIGSWALLLAVIEGLSVLGEYEQAAEFYPLVREGIDTGTLIDWSSCNLPEAAAGMAAAAGQMWEVAEKHYQVALQQAHDIPVVIRQPEVRRWYACMLANRNAAGDSEKARALLAEAVAMYRRINMPRHVKMAKTLLDGI